MPTELTSFVRHLFPPASAELLALFDSAIDNAAPLFTDFLSIRDLLDISGCQDHESLHVLLLLMFLALEEGSLCVEIAPAALQRRLTDLAAEPHAKEWAERIVADLEQHKFPELIGRSPDDGKPLLLFSNGDKAYLYFHKFLRSELVLRKQLDARIREVPAQDSGKDWEPILHDVLEERPLKSAGQTLLPDADQLSALRQALARNFLVISGGPGTGKTSIVLTLLRCLVRGGVHPSQIALAAPTGRAAQRLTDSLRAGLEKISPAPSADDARLQQLQASTLHHLLEFSPTRGTFRRHAENPLDADVVLVDEVSMVGVVLMAQLLQALRPECKLILLGDKDQLPSVEAGAVLASLVSVPAAADAPVSSVSLLRINHRSQPEIRSAAAAINEQDAELADRLPAITLPTGDGDSARWKALERQGGCWLIDQAGTQPEEIRRVLERWAHHHFLGAYPGLIRACELPAAATDDGPIQAQLRQLFQVLEGSRILTLVREGPWGCVGINDWLDHYLRPSLDRGARGHLFAGAPVLITANDHVRQLYNGDVGLTLKSRDGLRVVFPRRSGFLSLGVETLPSHELGVALTVHKSQGSEYDRVLLVLPPSGARRLLTKEILYTGITRARSLAIIAGSRETLRLAIRRKVLRESALLA